MLEGLKILSCPGKTVKKLNKYVSSVSAFPFRILHVRDTHSNLCILICKLKPSTIIFDIGLKKKGALKCYCVLQ